MLLRVLCLLVLAPLTMFSQQATPSFTARFERIQKQFADEQRAFEEAHRKATTDEQRNQLIFPDRDKYGREMLALAEQHIQDPVSIGALIWTLAHSRHGSESAANALSLLQKHHIADERMEAVCEALEFNDTDATQAFLKQLIDKNPHRKVKAAAALALGQIHAEENPRQAERYFKDVAEKYGTPQQIESARQHLFEMQNLAIGKAAPEIEGQDIDGNTFKLSDYRGKVVVLSFWGDW